MPRQPPCAPGMSRDRLHCPQNSFQTTRTRASMQLKREIGLLCKEDAVLTSTFRRARAGTEVAVTSTRGLWRIWSPACEELSRRLPSRFGWVRPVRSAQGGAREGEGDRKSTRLNSSHLVISYAVFCLKKKKKKY